MSDEVRVDVAWCHSFDASPLPLSWAPSPWTFHIPIHFNSNLRFYFHVITVTHSETPVFHPYGDRSLL
jgi:hypothetical protein